MTFNRKNKMAANISW